MDGLCIGQNVRDKRFDEVSWIVPNKELTKQACRRIACKPEVALRGYSSETQKQLAEALSWIYGSIYPYHNQHELITLADELHDQYGNELVFYDGISSNAYSEAIAQHKVGWLGRSSMFNPLDPSDNAAELVLVDPATRPLLQPTSMPDSGEIHRLPPSLLQQCSSSLPIH